MKFVLKTILIVCALSTTALFAQPKLEIIGGDTYDWGTVKPTDNPLKAHIVLKNSGNQILNITEVRPGCGCTTAPITKNEIKPGDTASLSVTLNFGNHNSVVKSIKISSNDSANNPKYLFLKANVYYPLSIEPSQYFALNECEVGKLTQAKLTLKNNSKNSMVLSDFVTEPAIITLNVMGKKILAPGEQFDLIASVKPVAPGIINGLIKLKTSDPDMKDVTMQVYGTIKESTVNLPTDSKLAVPPTSPKK